MATFPSEFIELAAELIGDEFEAFASDAVLERATGVDYDTQSETKEVQTLSCIRMDYESQQIAGLVAVGDFMLIGQNQLLSWQPSPDDTFATFDGLKHQVKSVKIDPAGATIIMQVRPL